MDALLPVTGVHHLGVVVKDCARSMASFSRIFGISSWDVQTLTNASFRNPRVRGRDLPQHFISAVSVGGAGNFELCQPLGGDRSVYAEYLDATGGGLHHSFASMVTQDEFAILLPALEQAGIGFAQQADLSNTVDYYYCDTQAQLGTLAELVVIKGPNPKGGPPETINFGPEVTEAAGRPPLTHIAGYGILRDAAPDALMGAYGVIYGIAGWIPHAHGSTGTNGPLSVSVSAAGDGGARAPDMHHIITNTVSRSTLERSLPWLQAEGITLARGVDTADGSPSCLLDARERLDGMFINNMLAD